MRSFAKSTPINPTESDNVYFNDPESGAEMARLIDQDHLITKGMGGLFAERPDLSGILHVLDVDCGPGGWAQEVGFAYPEVGVVGIDIIWEMIVLARAQ